MTSTYSDRIRWARTNGRLTAAQAVAALGEPLDPLDPAAIHAALDAAGVPRTVATNDISPTPRMRDAPTRRAHRLIRGGPRA